MKRSLTQTCSNCSVKVFKDDIFQVDLHSPVPVQLDIVNLFIDPWFLKKP